MNQSFNALKPKAIKINRPNNNQLSFQPQNIIKVTDIRHLTPSTYVLRMERQGIKFNAGQHISLGTNHDGEAREYSIYSGESDDFIEVLIREVEDGLISKKLKRVKQGDRIGYNRPVGYFQIPEDERESGKFLFIASGTGIAPFHSFIESYPGLNYKLLHGVRTADEAYEKEVYDPENFILCTSRDTKGDYHGRVTDYLKNRPVEKDIQVYLCGNCEMIHDAYDILLDKGVPAANIHSEVYF